MMEDEEFPTTASPENWAEMRLKFSPTQMLNALHDQAKEIAELKKQREFMPDIRNRLGPMQTLLDIIKVSKVTLEDDSLTNIFETTVRMARSNMDYIRDWEPPKTNEREWIPFSTPPKEEHTHYLINHKYFDKAQFWGGKWWAYNLDDEWCVVLFDYYLPIPPLPPNPKKEQER